MKVFARSGDIRVTKGCLVGKSWWSGILLEYEQTFCAGKLSVHSLRPCDNSLRQLHKVLSELWPPHVVGTLGYSTNLIFWSLTTEPFGLPLVPCFWFVLIRHWKSSWASLSMETGGRSRTLGARLLQNVSGCASSVFQVPFVKLGDGLDSTVTQILDTIESSQVQVYII